MWSPHPHQKALCAMFLSLALITYYSSLKEAVWDETKPKNFSLNNYINFSGANGYNSLEIFKDFEKSPTNEFSGARNKGGRGSTDGSNKEDVIHILGLFELTSKWGRKEQGESEMTAAKLAVEHVNAYKLLPGYKLELLVNDTKCDPGVATDRFFHAIYSQKTIVMLLGAGCSNVSERLAHVVPYWNILQVSFGSKSPTLSDRSKFPLFFRTVAPDSSHNSAKIQFVKRFGWKVVATFSQSENAYLLPVNYLVTELEKVNVSCISTVTFSPENYREQLRVLKDLDIRIIIGSFSYVMAAKIFCAVFEMNMFGADYVWILQEHDEAWWESDKECSKFHLKLALEGIIVVADYEYIGHDRQAVVSLLETSILEELLNVSKTKISRYIKQTYDAVWAIALTLKESDYILNPIKDFHYNRKDMVCRFFDVMSNLSFVGLSFLVLVLQARQKVVQQEQDFLPTDGHLSNIAIYESTRNKLNFYCESCHHIRWQNGQIPVAKRILKLTLVTVPDELFYTVLTASLLGIIVALLFFYFNLHFRRLTESGLLSSRKMWRTCLQRINYLVYRWLKKCYKFESEVADRLRIALFKLFLMRIYLLSAGFSLAFGSMFAKSYRVHRLFAYTVKGLLKNKLLKDKQLIGLIFVPTLIDGLIMTLWLMIDPMERHLHNLTLQTSRNDPGVVYQQQIEVCSCHNTVGWYFALFGYKGIILLMGVYMAWKTRRIKIPALNESQYIAICVYCAVFSTLIVILFSFLTEYFILSYIAKTTSILTATTVTLFLLFLPKLKSVFRKIDTEESIMQSLGLKIEYKTRRFILDDPKELIYRLEIQNKVHRCELDSLEKEIATLEELLLHTSSTCSTKSDGGNVETTAELHYLNVPTVFTVSRASWPSTRENQLCQNLLTPMDQHQSQSENKLNADRFFGFFGKLKKIFGSFTSLQGIGSNVPQTLNSNRVDSLVSLHNTGRLQLRSYPDLSFQLQQKSQNELTEVDFSKVRSEGNINQPTN